MGHPTFPTTHPVAVAGSQAVLQLLEGGVLAAAVLAHLWAVQAPEVRGIRIGPRLERLSGRGWVAQTNHSRTTCGARLYHAQVGEGQLGTR